MLDGERLVVSGVVKPYVAGQKVVVRFSRDGREVATKHGRGAARERRGGPLPPRLRKPPARAW